MFASLRGDVVSVAKDSMVLEVGGVGYLVSCSSRTLDMARDAREVGQEVFLLVETVVREDSIRLFGFADEEEQTWFRILTTVQGVGGRIALNILGALGVSGLVDAIVTGDKASLRQADGVGERIAARVVSELEGKAPAREVEGEGPRKVNMDHLASARAALLKLGFKADEASRALKFAIAEVAGEDLRMEVLLKEALRILYSPKAG